MRRGHRDHKFQSLEYVDGNVAMVCRTSFKIRMDDVYATALIQEWFKQFAIDDLHLSEDGMRLIKAPSIYAFEDYYSRGNYYRQPSSYQVNSSLREFHDGLLWNEKYNPDHKAKSVIAIYNRMARGNI